MATEGKSVNVAECEEYVEQHGIQTLLKECISVLCQERPANPYRWLRDYFERLDKVSSTNFFFKCMVAALRLSFPLRLSPALSCCL